MDCVLHTLSFLFEEDKVRLFLSCRSVYLSHFSELEAIKAAFFVLRSHQWDRSRDLALSRAIDWDLDSVQSCQSE